MAKVRSMTRSQNHDEGASSSREKRPKSYAPWSDLDHDVLYIVMMQLGVVDFLSFRGVCKSWRSLACENQNMFMTSMPPMSVSVFFSGAFEKTCYLEDFESRRSKIVLPWFSSVGDCIGVTRGYLIFFEKSTRDFWLVNPITRKLLHFPDFPFDYHPNRAILVFSPSLSGLVFVVLCKKEIWFCIARKGAWNRVSSTLLITDICAFKGKMYTLSYDYLYPFRKRFCLCELRPGPGPKFTFLETKKRDYFYVDAFVSSGENLYAMDCLSKISDSLHELDIGEMKWVNPCEKTLEEYAFFHSNLNHVVAVKRESWADPRSRSHRSHRFFTAKTTWYFPHECMNVDRVE